MVCIVYLGVVSRGYIIEGLCEMELSSWQQLKREIVTNQKGMPKIGRGLLTTGLKSRAAI